MIGLHQDHQRNIHVELDSVLGNDTEKDVTTEHMKELKYLECVIKVRKVTLFSDISKSCHQSATE